MSSRAEMQVVEPIIARCNGHLAHGDTIEQLVAEMNFEALSGKHEKMRCMLSASNTNTPSVFP